MEVVSNSNLVSWVTKKTRTACSFQHDWAMRGQTGSYAYRLIFYYIYFVQNTFTVKYTSI